MEQKDPPVVPGASRPDVEALTQALAAPFERTAVKIRPGAVSGNRALALPYVDARAIQDRLDSVLGVAGWQDEYECLADGSVVCRLRLRLGDEWITKMDVGGPSEQPDEGDRRKAAFSDALKRAAVKFGVGRYLYRLPQKWLDYDPQKRKFADTASAPAPAAAPAPARATPKAAPPQAAPTVAPAPASPASAPPAVAVASVEPPNRGVGGLPANGLELRERLYAKDKNLAERGLCQPGDLVKAVVQAGKKAGFDGDLTNWSGPAILLAVEETKAFAARLRPTPEHKDVA